MKKELENLGESLGNRIGHAVSGKAETKGSELGKKAGAALARQMERLAEALDKEEVSKEEQLGLGGKIGTGLGILAKHAMEKRCGLLGRMLGSGSLVSGGRAAGAKAEKMVKRVVKDRVQRVVAAKARAKEDGEKET